MNSIELSHFVLDIYYISFQDELRKKTQKDAMKRKNYEIKTLKTELSEREESLFDTEYRLATLENSMVRDVM